MSHSLPHLTLTTRTSSLSPISSTSAIFPTVSLSQTSPVILNPYIPCDGPRQGVGSTQIPSLTDFDRDCCRGDVASSSTSFCGEDFQHNVGAPTSPSYFRFASFSDCARDSGRDEVVSDRTFQNDVGILVPRSVVDVPVPQVFEASVEAVMVTFRELTSGVECRHWFEKPQQSPTVESLGSVDALVVVTLVNKIRILALLPSLSPLVKWKISDLQPGVTPHNLDGSAAFAPSSSPILE